MPTQQEIIEQLNATITKLTASNIVLESKYELACKENDLLTKHNKELNALVSNYQILTSHLNKPVEGFNDEV